MNDTKKMLLLLCVLAALPASAKSRRLHVEAMEYPWSAAGRLNIGGRGWCSAILIGPRHIVTAAHCLWNRQNQSWWPASSIHFIAGYQGGEASLVSVAASIVIADGYDASVPGSDWAVVELTEPLGESAGWIAGTAGSQTPPGPIGQLGYRADSAHAMTLDIGCKMILKGLTDGLLWDDCDAAHGDSGGPLLSFTKEGPHLIGLVVLAGRRDGQSVTGSIPASVLSDRRRFPLASAAAEAAGWGRPARPPAEGSPVARLPVQTLADLGGGDRKPSLELLSILLGRP
jgi:protease YdgD